MIQLRWYTRIGKSFDRVDMEWHDCPERVLQFRTQVMQIGSGYRQVGAGDGSTYVAEYQRPVGMTWTDWQDVPEDHAPPAEPPEV